MGSIERIKKIPHSSWELKNRQLFLRIGCAGCVNQILLKALGGSGVPYNIVEKGSFSDVWGDTECPAESTECPYREDISAAIELIELQARASD